MSSPASCISRSRPLGTQLGRSSGAGVVRACRPTRQHRPQATVCLAGAMLATSPSEATFLIQAASAVAWTSAVFMAGRLFLGQQSQAEEEPRQECESCKGTGYVECWCSRWSDDDSGCGTCRGSGMMVCSSCRGGGTSVPILAKLVIRNERTDNFRQYK